MLELVEEALDEISVAIQEAEKAGKFLRFYMNLTLAQTPRWARFVSILPAGFQAAENEIAAQRGMSRTPVHEAMARLQEEGFVQILPRKGILVRALTPPDLLELYDILIALEGAAAELLAADIDAAQVFALPELQASTEAMDAALRDNDLEGWRAADERRWWRATNAG